MIQTRELETAFEMDGVSCVILKFDSLFIYGATSQTQGGGRTGLMVRASDSGSGDPGSILGRVDVLFP